MVKRMLPRFEVVEVQRGIGNTYLAYDHLNKSARYPLDAKSKPQAQSLVELLAMTARANGEVLSLLREDNPTVKP